MRCCIQQVLPKKHAQPLHRGPKISLPSRGQCSIKSSFNAKAGSCGVAWWLFSTLPSWRLTLDPLVKVSDNIAIKDLVLILTFIAQSTSQERSEQGGIRDAFAQLLPHRSAGHCSLPTCSGARKAGEAGGTQEVRLLGLHLVALAGLVPGTHRHIHCAGISLGSSSPIPEKLHASIFRIFLPPPFRSCQILSKRKKRTNLPFIWAWDLPHVNSSHCTVPIHLCPSKTFLGPR